MGEVSGRAGTAIGQETGGIVTRRIGEVTDRLGPAPVRRPGGSWFEGVGEVRPSRDYPRSGDRGLMTLC